MLLFRGSHGPAHEDEFVADLTVPLDLPRSAIAAHVENVIRGLFARFGGKEFESRAISEMVDETLRH